ncbi:MAG: hypothetical protein HQL45_00730 [Alphaproteobacteria bacterium]|nr:hypothetical protein [Alphaproteobacteria bacterium]
MKNRIAVAICLHHKPWLAMGSLISLMLQDFQDFDLFLLFNEGDGTCNDKLGYAKYRELLKAETAESVIALSVDVERRSYAEYDQLARQKGINPKLSPFDQRLHELCALNRRNVQSLSFENDQSLDSGVWLKFIRTGAWKDYDYLFTFQEGTLLTSSASLTAALEAASTHNIDFLASAHMKGRIPKSLYTQPGLPDTSPEATDIDRFHNQSVAACMELLCRDPDLKRAFDAWGDKVAPTRQYHIRDLEVTLRMRLLAAILEDRPLTGARSTRRLKKLLRILLPEMKRSQLEDWLSRASFLAREHLGISFDFRRDPGKEYIFVDGKRTKISDVVSTVAHKDVLFHKSTEPGWHAAGCNHMFSSALLSDLEQRFENNGLYSILDMPFAGSLLELFWTYVPGWLGRDLWFWDGFHRVTKDPWTLQREDSPEGLALFLNRYYFGEINVYPDDDFLKLRNVSSQYDYLRLVLPKAYFP